MRIFYILLFLLFIPFLGKTQTVTVSGQCISGTITLTQGSDIDGKPSYTGAGTVLGNPGLDVAIYWMGGSDNLWVLTFSGQPFYTNSCNTSLPPSSSSSSCTWENIDASCSGSPLIVNGSGTLPVSLVNFTAREENNQALLHWKTSSEINNKGFEIQRSKDGFQWNKIGFVNGIANSTQQKDYSFIDEAPLPGKNFYRLLQYDLDGKSVSSPVVNVDIFKAGYYTISNNPGNGIYRLNLHSTKMAIISVSDMSGRRLLQKQMDAGIHPLDISRYAPGTYLLRLKIGSDVFTEKLVKQ